MVAQSERFVDPNPLSSDPIRNGSRNELRLQRSLLTFFELVGKLSEIERQGWVDRGIQKPESVAAHSYQVALLVMSEAPMREGVDVLKAAKMALYHDLPEIIRGDITPYSAMPPEARPEALRRWTPPTREELKAKHDQERAALEVVTRGLPTSLRQEMTSLWLEFEEGVSPEAKFVRQMDIKQRLIQAERYRELVGESFPITSFFQEARQTGDPELIRLVRRFERKMKKNKAVK